MSNPGGTRMTSTGIVTEHLINLIARQVDDNGIIVWYDPGGIYSEAVDVLNLPQTTCTPPMEVLL